MTKSTNMQYSFNGGELSPLLDGRIDYPKYESGAKEMTNFVPTVYGPITKRPGTAFIDSFDVGAELYPFEFNQEQSYVVAFKEDGGMEFYFGDGKVTLTTPLTHPFGSDVYNMSIAQNGDICYFANTVHGLYKLSRIATDEFTLERATLINGPFQDDNIDENELLRVENIGQGGGEVGSVIAVDFVGAQAEYRVGEYIRMFYEPASKFDTWSPLSSNFDNSEKEYSLGDNIQYEGRVYSVEGADPSTSLPSQTGTRSPLHEADDESDGNLILRYVGDEWGYVRVDSEEALNRFFCTVIRPLPVGLVPEVDGESTATTSWANSAFAGELDPSFGHPGAITFHEQRLVLSGSLQQPQTIWGSVIGRFEDFARGLNDDDSYSFGVASTRKNPIVWLASNVTLQVGTTGAEFNATSSGAAITPTDINVSQITTYGSSEGTPAIISNGFTLFVQAGGNKIRELRYSDDTQRNFARDLNKVAEHISYSGIKSMVYQGEPYQIIWCIIGTELYGLTYETDEDVYAWHRHDVGGEVISASVIPAGSQDRLWLLVKRDDSYFIEFITPFFNRVQDQSDAIFLDSSLSYNGVPTDTVSGLDHLEGKVVQVLGDGSVMGEFTVVNGSITIPDLSSVIHVGLGYKAAWQSMRLIGGSQEGIAQGKTKSLKNIIFRLDATGSGLRYGLGFFENNVPSFVSENYPYTPGYIDTRATDDFMDEAPPLLFGDTEISGFPGGKSKEFYVRMEHDLPTPCTIISYMTQLDTNER